MRAEVRLALRLKQPSQGTPLGSCSREFFLWCEEPLELIVGGAMKGESDGVENGATAEWSLQYLGILVLGRVARSDCFCGVRGDFAEPADLIHFGGRARQVVEKGLAPPIPSPKPIPGSSQAFLQMLPIDDFVGAFSRHLPCADPQELVAPVPVWP